MVNNEKDIQLFDHLLEENKLTAYFQRIGYSGEVSPTLECLKALQYLHPQAIAFENLNPFLGLPVDLNFPAIFDKLVSEGRGGYCFEHNLLLGQVLRTIGFRVSGLSARVFWEIPEGLVRPRDHMLLAVQVKGRDYIADVGFGGTSLTGPLQLYFTAEQETPHELFRVLEIDGFFYVEIKIKENWRKMYRFGLEMQLLQDYEVTSWYLCTHPTSLFRKNLMVARSMPWGRYALHNNKMSIHRLNGKSEKKTIASASELKSILEEVFLIQLPDKVGMQEKLKDLLTGDQLE
ncbi:MAG: arylamine N-acetyltransferase [Cyclobacteriaceae bacterium]